MLLTLAIRQGRRSRLHERHQSAEPEFAGAWYNLGNLLSPTTQRRDRMRCAVIAGVLELSRADLPGAYENIALLLQRLGRHRPGRRTLSPLARRSSRDNPIARHMAGCVFKPGHAAARR